MWLQGDTRCHYSKLVGPYEWWVVKVQQRRAACIATTIASAFIVACIIFSLNRDSYLCSKKKQTCTCNLIVPDIVHFYRSDREAANISRPDSLCLRAAGRLHEQVWIHTTDVKSTHKELNNLGLTELNFKTLPAPYGPGPVHLNILRKYGGIFLKNDIYLLDRLDHMRGHDWSSAGEKNDIVAGTQDGVASGMQLKLKDVLYDKNYGALYIKDLLQNCTYSAVRLGVR